MWSTTIPAKATSSARRCRSAGSTICPTTGLQDDRRYYEDVTGTGNTLNLDHPRVLQLVTARCATGRRDACRRVPLRPRADAGREGGEYSQGSAFFDTIRQDPELAGAKLIAEPWDVGPGGYQLGNFPPGWAEWNGQYRDVVRRFWKGDSGLRRRHGFARRRLVGHFRLSRAAAVGEYQFHHRA